MLTLEPVAVKEKRKIALVGTCPSSRLLAPYGDKEWTIWACSENNARGVLPRVDAWFELHADLMWEPPAKWEEAYIAWLNEQTFKLYAQRVDLFPKAIRFPHEEMLREFGPDWFTSTLAWMMAFAIVQKPDEIGIYGCDMSHPSEYGHQRPAMKYFIEMAGRRGIQVYVPSESDLLRPAPLYGYSVGTDRGRKWETRRREVNARVQSLQSRRSTLVDQTAECDRQIIHLQGVLDQLDYDITTWSGEDVPVAPPATATDVVRPDFKRKEA